MIKHFCGRLIGYSIFSVRKLLSRQSLFIFDPHCCYSTLLSTTAPFTRAAIHWFPACYYGNTIYPVNQISEYSSVSNTTDEYLDYINFSDLAESSDVENKIKLIIMEYELSKQSGGKVPSTITVADMRELLQFSHSEARTRYFYYLFKKEKDKLADKRRKEKRRAEHIKRKQEREATQTGPKNTFFIFIRNPSMLKFYNSRQAHSMLFGSTLVFDMAYEEFMRKRDKINCAYQISMAYGANKVHKDPFNLYLCNAKSEYETMHYLSNSVPHLQAANCMINITEMSYLDIFRKEKIVYLTPNAPEVLHNFDHDAVYIIGGYVDKSNPKQLSLAKAKRENLKMAKLPLDYHLHWGKAGKALTLNQMMEIMLEVKCSNNWKKAFEFVPSRKLCTDDPDVERILRFNKKTKDSARKLKTSLFVKE